MKKSKNPVKSSAKRIFRRYKDGNLTFDQFLDLSKQNCHYCNSPPSNSYNCSKDSKFSSEYQKQNGNFIYNGLDRIDNSLPHNLNNIVVCCKYCNYSKRERTLLEFKNWVENIYAHFINKKGADQPLQI